MRHIAIEAGEVVVSVPLFIPASASRMTPGTVARRRGRLRPRGACVVSPGGDVIAGAPHDAQGIVIGDCGLRSALRARRYFDVVGHHGRADVLAPSLPTLPS